VQNNGRGSSSPTQRAGRFGPSASNANPTLLRPATCLRRLDWVMFGTVTVLIALGLAFIYSSRYSGSDAAARTLCRKQLLWAGLGMFCYLAAAAVDYRVLRRICWGIYAISIVLLGLVLLVGPVTGGAQRWLVVGGLGIQPSELAKLASVSVLATLLGQAGAAPSNRRELYRLLGIVALPVLLILLEPAVGTAAVFIPTTCVMLFVAGTPLRLLLELVGMGLAAGGILLGTVLLPEQLGLDQATQHRTLRLVGLRPYHQRRIKVFINPAADPRGVGWNRRQSELAVGSGGPWGKGYLAGTQNRLGFLPRGVAPTDFLYSVIAEEKGYLGTAVVLGLFAILLLRGLRLAKRTWDPMGRLLCVGIMTTIFTHVVINLGMSVGLLPGIGLPLPLLSYGGSFTVVTLASLGLVQSVQTHT